MLKFCVLGSGIAYTLSPKIHGMVFDMLGVSATYGVEDIPPEALGSNIPRLKETYDGLNVTKPHKAAILPFLAENRAPFAAVNTVVKRKGEWVGDNTDLYGFMSDLRALVGDPAGMRTLVLGAGGAAEAVVCGLASAGADVTVVNRTASKAAALASRYNSASAARADGLRPELIVNCTSVGNDGRTNPLPLGVDTGALRFAYDLVYAPPRTAFLRACEEAGAKTSNGLGMLVRQAIRADEIFLGRELEKEALAAEVKAVWKEGE